MSEREFSRDEYILVQPAEAKEKIGCGTRMFYEHAKEQAWCKTRLEGGKVAYQVPVQFVQDLQEKCNRTTTAQPAAQSSAFAQTNIALQLQPHKTDEDLLDFMREVREEYRDLNAQVGSMTAMAYYFRMQCAKLEAENARLRKRRFFGLL